MAIRYQRAFFFPFHRWRIKMPRIEELYSYCFLCMPVVAIVTKTVSEARNAMSDSDCLLLSMQTLAPPVIKR